MPMIFTDYTAGTVMFLNFRTQVWANSVDPEQTALWLGSTQFAILSACFGHTTYGKINISQFLW